MSTNVWGLMCTPADDGVRLKAVSVASRGGEDSRFSAEDPASW